MIKTIKSLEELDHFVANFLANLEVSEKATVLGLSGDLGSGKTTFVQKLVLQLGGKEGVTSPTFVIQKGYQLPEGSKFKKIFHLDAYRLDSGQDLLSLGFKELLEEKNTLIVIEWPEKVSEILPADAKYLDFKFIDQTTREISNEE